MAAAGAIFVGPNGQDARSAIRAEIHALSTTTVGDMLYVGQLFRSRIRTRTFQGVDVNGQPFQAYSQRGPYYLYANGTATKDRHARSVAAKNRHAATGKIGIRTPTGIKYVSYAAAKSAHGVGNVNLYGMQQHTHMLDTMIVRAGGAELDSAAGDFMGGGGEMDAFEQNVPQSQLAVGFYGPEAERAKGNNEGTSKLPKREFFALSQEDLMIAERAIAGRMMIRARAGHGGPAGPGAVASTGGSDDWIGF